jgi:hypothetical protein
MPAASSDKRARQRANKLQRMEAEAATSSNVLPAPQTAEITSESLPTPAPTSLTISYTPLIHPEPAATRSGTNAIQVTQFELSKMLRQAFQQGSEQGYQLDLADAIEKLNAQYDDRHFEALNDFADRMQESSDIAFGEGFSAGIEEERKRCELTQVSKVNVATQTNPSTTISSISASVQTNHLSTSTSTTATASVQTNIPLISPSSSASISTQTEPLLISSDSLPVPIFEPPIPAIIDSAPFDWATDTFSPSTLPLIISKQPRDLSSLRSSSKNPFSSLHRRHHYLKRPKNISSHHYTQFHPTHPPFYHTPPLTNLNWHHDPRLSELSRVLRSLGWSHP